MTNVTAVRISIGGNHLLIQKVVLHSAAAVGRWQSLMAEAQPLLGTFSSGLTVWGSPGAAIAAGAAIGFLEAAVTNANQKKGVSVLTEAVALHERLKQRGVFVPVNEINEISSPSISRWHSRGEVDSEMDVRQIGMFDRSRLKKEYGATDEEISAGFIIRKTIQDLIILPDDFVTCECDGKIVMIKWSNVEMFELVVG